MITIERLSPHNESEWQHFVDTLVKKEYAFSLKWRKILKTVFAYDDLYYLIRNKGKLVGLFPAYFVKSRILKNRLISIPFTDMGGFYFDPSVTINLRIEAYSKIKECLNADLRALSINPIPLEIRGPYSDSNKFLLTECQFIEITPYVKFILKLDVPWQDIENRFHKSVKRVLAKSTQEIKIDRCLEKKFLPEIYSVYLQDMKRLGSLPLPFVFFENLWEEFGEEGNFIILTASLNKKIIGAITLIAFKDIVYADLLMSDIRYKHYNPKSLLYFKSIEYAWKTQKYKIYDFNRTRKDTGVYQHKSKWGGQMEDIKYCYPSMLDKNNCFMDPSQKNFTFMANLIKKCPALFLKMVGGLLRKQVGK